MSRGTVFDPVISGTKVMAVFGFCDIRNFTDCCEVLEEETMVFTNAIASIVHNRVHSSGGVVNKNIGDAFLAVWKIKAVPVTDDASRVISQHPSTRRPNDGSASAIQKAAEADPAAVAERQRRKSTFGIGAQKLAAAGLGGHGGSTDGDTQGYTKGASSVPARHASLGT